VATTGNVVGRSGSLIVFANGRDRRRIHENTDFLAAQGASMMCPVVFVAARFLILGGPLLFPWNVDTKVSIFSAEKRMTVRI
jgi:hypothetical protein